MQELIVTIVKGLVDDKDAVSVTVDEPKEDVYKRQKLSQQQRKNHIGVADADLTAVGGCHRDDGVHLSLIHI